NRRSARASNCPSPMNAAKLKALLEEVATGRVATPDAERILLEALRAQPFEDLGFARVDHHRALRQGFPEVVLGLGKTSAQIASISAAIVSRGSTLLVTRAGAADFEAVRAAVPAATYYADASLITL